MLQFLLVYKALNFKKVSVHAKNWNTYFVCDQRNPFIALFGSIEEINQHTAVFFINYLTIFISESVKGIKLSISLND
jgi:hypothetical protein